MKKKCVLILGGSSDIGINLIKKYINEGWNVICHYNQNSLEIKKLKKNYKNELSLYKVNFDNENSVNKFINFLKKYKIYSMINLVGYLDNISFKNTSVKSLYKSLKINS